MTKNKTGLYIGSRDDIIPLLVFPEIQRWIYIDAVPAMKAGFQEDDYPADKRLEMYLKDICFELGKAGFELARQEPKHKMLVFQKGKREVYYFHSTVFPACTKKQKDLMCDATYLYMSAFTPDKSVLSMVCQTKPLTLLIWHAPLYYNWENGGNFVVDFENSRSLVHYLLNHYVENVKYIFVNDTKISTKHGGIRQLIRDNVKLDVSSVEKIPCLNLLDYNYKEEKTNNRSFKTLKQIPRVDLLVPSKSKTRKRNAK
jgi:hypothetical protein